MRHTNGLRHVFLEDELDLTTTVAIIDQATVETVQTVCSAEFYTYVTDEQLDKKINKDHHSTHDSVDAIIQKYHSKVS